MMWGMLSISSGPDRAVSQAPAVALAGAILLIAALAAALTVDVVTNGYGVKSDESTYVAMTLSAAYDHDFSYQRRDLERFEGLYRAGPDGIFLKRGKVLHLRVNRIAPFVHLTKTPDTQNDRLYFGKALIYPLVAAPFVRLFGLNGFLVVHVLLLFGVCVCGYTFLAARSRPAPALLFTLAFVFATCVPVYAVFLMPEVLNFSLVFFALFLWLYKEVSPEPAGGFLRSRWSDLAAAVLIGLAAYSKINHAIFIAPIVLWAWWQRRFVSGLLVGIVFVATVVAFFGLTAATSGEFNYQGGDRKSFIGSYPFDASAVNAWDRRGIEMTTNDADTETVLAPSEFVSRFAHNVEYFAIGRHFGLVPYFFPAIVCLVLWLGSAERSRGWRVLTFLAIAGSFVFWLVFAPFTWSGGGGPSGNRYFMSQYPAFFFLLPPMTSSVPALIAWLGGALFTAKMLVNPFYAAKFPQVTAQRGFVRLLPVELTMANDLPIMLDAQRSHLWYGNVLMYFLDDHAYPPEIVGPNGEKGIWVAGDGRADMVVRSESPIDHLRMTVMSPIATEFIVSMGRGESRVALVPGKPVTVDVAASGVRGLESYAYLLSARSTNGFTPHLQAPDSADLRNLGVVMTFVAVPIQK
jgi:hypothetical protein